MTERPINLKHLYYFWKVATQTLTAPIVTAMLYLLIFGHVLEEHVQVLDGVSYTAFLVPGLVMMTSPTAWVPPLAAPMV